MFSMGCQSIPDTVTPVRMGDCVVKCAGSIVNFAPLLALWRFGVMIHLIESFHFISDIIDIYYTVCLFIIISIIL
jgi:hypothetical protein